MAESPLDFGGLLSAFSDDESFEETFSSFSDAFRDDFERFRSSLDLSLSFESLVGESSDLRSFDDFFSSLRGAAPQAPQEEPSRTTRGRSFFEDLGSGGGVG